MKLWWERNHEATSSYVRLSHRRGRDLLPADRNGVDEIANQAMEACADGDEAAFGTLYDLLAPRLYSFLVKQLRDFQRAEDVLQETFLSIHRTRGTFVKGADVVPWAFAIARRACIDRHRRGNLEASLSQELFTADGFSGEADPGADAWLHARELATRVEAEFAQLPESQRIAFDLVRGEGLSHVKAAEALGTTTSAVKLRVHRAYQRLRRAFP
jgi:RNA polymerase sigma-70 factor, ECF subfamily